MISYIARMPTPVCVPSMLLCLSCIISNNALFDIVCCDDVGMNRKADYMHVAVNGVPRFPHSLIGAAV